MRRSTLFTETSNVTVDLVAGRWSIDSAHTLVQFGVRHYTIARVAGRFTGVSGELVVADDPASAPRVHATIEVGSVQSGHPKRDELIRSPEFLDASGHPHMSFVSDRFTPLGDGRYAVGGALTIKGVTREVELEATFGGVVTHRGAVRSGFSATTTIDRRDFGITWNVLLDTGDLVVSHAVCIELEIELTLDEG
jgi:polyisoprenoid-binding protein YceI